MDVVIVIGHLIPPLYPSGSNLRTSNFPNFQPSPFKSLRTNFHPLICAASSNGGGNGNSSGEEKQRSLGGEENGSNENFRPRLNMKWVDLLVNPDPDNVVAVGLTGVLAWASVQVLWQLFVISIAIVLAALKYSFIAALLIFILITLL